MPSVELTLDVAAPADRVWAAVVDIERYPESMKNVRWVEIREQLGPDERRSGWSIVLKGSILEWEEREDLDHENRIMSFHQLSGDLDIFDGRWVVEEKGPELTAVSFHVRFEASPSNEWSRTWSASSCQGVFNGSIRGSSAISPPTRRW